MLFPAAALIYGAGYCFEFYRIYHAKKIRLKRLHQSHANPQLEAEIKGASDVSHFMTILTIVLIIVAYNFVPSWYHQTAYEMLHSSGLFFGVFMLGLVSGKILNFIFK